jgi:uncharacterized protein
MDQTNLVIQSQPHKLNSIASSIQAHPLTAYFILAFAGTWLVFSPAVFARGLGWFSMPDVLAFALLMLATFTGPMTAALLVTGAVEGKTGIKAFLRRIIRFRVGVQWYLIVILGYPLVLLIALVPVMGVQAYAGWPSHLPAFFTAYLPAILVNLFMPALGEETGWRGFALPRLQRLHGPLLGSLILGGLHALWHLPAYLVPGFMQSGAFDPVYFIGNSGAIVAATILWTWLNNHANQSIFFAMLVHACSNASPAMVTQVVGKIHPDAWFGLILFGIIAVMVILLTRGRLSYPVENRPSLSGESVK